MQQREREWFKGAVDLGRVREGGKAAVTGGQPRSTSHGQETCWTSLCESWGARKVFREDGKGRGEGCFLAAEGDEP